MNIKLFKITHPTIGLFFVLCLSTFVYAEGLEDTDPESDMRGPASVTEVESGPLMKDSYKESIEQLSRECDLENSDVDDFSQNQEFLRKKNLQVKQQNNTNKQKQNRKEASVASIQINSKSKNKSACLRLYDAEKQFESDLKQTNCEAQTQYMPNEKDILACQKAGKTSRYERFDVLAKRRDECISRLRAEACRNSKQTLKNIR